MMVWCVGFNLQSSLIWWTARCAALDPTDGAPKTQGTPEEEEH